MKGRSSIFIKAVLASLLLFPVFIIRSIYLVLPSLDTPHFLYLINRFTYVYSFGFSESLFYRVFGAISRDPCKSSPYKQALQSLLIDGFAPLPVDFDGILPSFTSLYGKPRINDYSLINYSDYLSQVGNSCVEASRFDFDKKQVESSVSLLNILCSEDLWAFANSYYKLSSKLVRVELWSPTYGTSGQYYGISAHDFHTDFDYPDIINIFVYMNDVGPNNGPLQYFIGTHLPPRIPRDGALDMALICKEYPKTRIVDLCGPRLSTFATLNRGFHRDKPVLSDSMPSKISLQLTYCSCTFGSSSHDRSTRLSLRNIELNYPDFYSKLIASQAYNCNAFINIFA
jgi:hypothetical protein